MSKLHKGTITRTLCPECSLSLMFRQDEWYENHGQPYIGERFSDEWYECPNGHVFTVEELAELKKVNDV